MEFFMEKDLTTGKITPQLIGFTIPLVLGNLFQLTYNAVDSIIVGRYVGKEALAAVGICNPISTLFILFLNGLCMGASILMGNGTPSLRSHVEYVTTDILDDGIENALVHYNLIP